LKLQAVQHNLSKSLRIFELQTIHRNLYLTWLYQAAVDLLPQTQQLMHANGCLLCEDQQQHCSRHCFEPRLILLGSSRHHLPEHLCKPLLTMKISASILKRTEHGIACDEQVKATKEALQTNSNYKKELCISPNIA
jgi:hypothetical protein